MMRPLLAIAMLASLGCAERREPRAPTPDRPHLEVMTYNLNYGIAGDDTTIAAIEKGDADLVLLQETSEAWEQSLRAALGERYPHMAFRHCCLAGGLGVLSKHPIADKRYLAPPSPEGWFPAWLLTVDSPIGTLQVLNVHLRPPLSESGSVVSGYFSTPPIRESQIAHYHAALDPDLPTLVVGDFNEGAGGRAIGYLAERGFRSALPEFEGSEPTWRWNTSVGTISSQLDHLIYSPELEPLAVRVIEAGRSDHLPVVGIFELRPRRAACAGSSCP